MQAQPTARSYAQLAREWSRLARRRRDHFIELYKSGRWRHYYSEAEFYTQLRDVLSAADEWEKLAGTRPEVRKAG